jgi:hypothetical protein
VPSSEQRSANGFEFVVRYEQRKAFYFQQQNSLSGATDFQFITALASNHRSELLADNIESTKCADISHDLFGERVVVAKNAALR